MWGVIVWSIVCALALCAGFLQWLVWGRSEGRFAVWGYMVVSVIYACRVFYFGGVVGIMMFVWCFVLLGIDYALSESRPYEVGRLAGGFCVFAIVLAEISTMRGSINWLFSLVNRWMGV